MKPMAHLIYLRPSGLVLSKKTYSDWREIQHEFDDYMTSLGPWTEAQIVSYFPLDYGEDDVNWPISKTALASFFASDKVTVECK
jgi:hypothetical protein